MSRPSTIFSKSVDESRAKLWRERLIAADGNITDAGRACNFSKQRAYALTEHFGLKDFARELRAAVGQPARGRPRLNTQGSVSKVLESKKEG